MIDINDYNREDLIASCLMEAASVLSESYGKNGAYGKWAEERYKQEKKRNDEHDAKIENKRKAYERAGYADKAPKFANRNDEKEYKKYSS